MMLLAKSIRGAFEKPSLELTFSAVVYRPTQTPTGIGSAKKTWTELPGPIPCDILPVTDEIRMLQAGQSEVMTHIMHFAENANVQSKDTIKIVSNRRLGSATVGSFFFVTEDLQPSEYYGFVRCRVTVGVEPTYMGPT